MHANDTGGGKQTAWKGRRETQTEREREAGRQAGKEGEYYIERGNWHKDCYSDGSVIPAANLFLDIKELSHVSCQNTDK